MQIAGLGVLQFLTAGDTTVRVTLVLELVGIGSYVGAAGYSRWKGNESSIRSGAHMHAARSNRTRFGRNCPKCCGLARDAASLVVHMKR